MDVEHVTSESTLADALTMIPEAGCAASSASNNRIFRFLVVQEAQLIRLVSSLLVGHSTDAEIYWLRGG